MDECKWPIWSNAETSNIKKCLQKGNWSRGEIIEEFERKFAEFCQCKYALLTNSGTHALKIAIDSVGIGEGDEVIAPGLTWPSTITAVLECAAKAVIVDIELDSYGISPAAVKENINSKTKAIIAVHLYCSSADLSSLLEIAKNNNLILIEDAAQVHGSQLRGKQLGTIGQVGIFSFQQKKIMTCGEGGCLVTNDERIFEKAYALRDHGSQWTERIVKRYGSNYRLSAICAAILLAQLDRLPELLIKEENNGVYLSEKLNAIRGIKTLIKRESITRQTFYSFCFRLLENELRDKRDKMINQLSKFFKIPFTSCYPPLDDKNFFRINYEQKYNNLIKFSKLINCHKAYNESLRFPHQFLLSSKKKINELIESIKQYAS